MPSRRRFVVSLASLAGLGFVGCRPETASTAPVDPIPEPSEGSSQAQPGPKKILILGGTGFLGPHFVRAATEKGHEVTLFNRGKTNPHLFPELEKLRGDRDGGLDALVAEVEKGRRWHAVVDTSGYVPRVVGESASLLANAADHYTFISSISVYGDPSKIGLNEDDAVGVLEDTSVEKVTNETYGPLKALCEEAAQNAFPNATARIRPGLIVGPGDRTDRFTYWPVRVSEGGKVLAPGDPTDPVQFIDVRDLAAWMVDCIENERAGIYNATGPATPTSVKDMIEGCARGAGTTIETVWVDAEFLAKHDVQPWMQMTVWVPPNSAEGGMGAVDVSRAVAEGLSFRPVEETAKDTLTWWNEQPAERREKPRAGLPREREAEVLAAWEKR